MSQITIGPDFQRPGPELARSFDGLQVSALGHLTDFGFPRGLRAVTTARRFAGPALTVRIPHLDSTAVHLAMERVRPGDVVVIDQSGDELRSSFGGTLAAVAAARGAVGAVCDGSTNDVDEIDALGFPVYSRGVTALTTRILGLEGAVNVPVCVGGTVVLPGDLVFGDEDGVAVVEGRHAAATARRLREFQERFAEADWLARIRDGVPLAELSGAARFAPAPGPAAGAGTTAGTTAAATTARAGR
ncbi:RraA family protein [Streptomyces paludis]|uniref:Putative 4-hydroxy-4-methyl-2-oxoglutarate aldolase n=1 Tax=Streptomyces paludis TaxID=2282738 RepID=A0A345HI74_9ACTN|nr:RraA family protein [Streptomyces paludis]AXG76398.1 RraA family protein [Streptomyces paludis]